MHHKNEWHFALDKEEMVSNAILTEEMIYAGATFVKELDQNSRCPESAFWLYAALLDKWKLVLIEPASRGKGPRDTYRMIQRLLVTSGAELSALSMSDISVLGPSVTIVKMLRTIVTTRPKEILRVRLRNKVAYGNLIEDVLVYRLADSSK